MTKKEVKNINSSGVEKQKWSVRWKKGSKFKSFHKMESTVQRISCKEKQTPTTKKNSLLFIWVATAKLNLIFNALIQIIIRRWGDKTGRRSSGQKSSWATCLPSFAYMCKSAGEKKNNFYPHVMFTKRGCLVSKTILRTQ